MTWRVGGHFNPGAVNLAMEGARREGTGSAAPVHSLTLNASLSW